MCLHHQSLWTWRSISRINGKDAARVYVTGCFNKKDEYTYDLRGLDETEAENDIQSWQQFFSIMINIGMLVRYNMNQLPVIHLLPVNI